MDPAAVRRGAAVAGAAAVGLAWLATPAHPIVAAVVGLAAVVAALHGLGRLVGWSTGVRDLPLALAVAWGLATWIAIGGALAATVGFAIGSQRALGLVGVIAGAVWVARRPRAIAPRAPLEVGPGLAYALAAGLCLLHALGAAATWTGALADADGHLLGPLTRLATTGALGDPIGLPRASGLGGNLVAHALVGPLGELRAAHAIDRGLGLGLTVALATALAPPGRLRAAVALAVALLASSIPEFPMALAPRWLAVALLLAIAVTLTRATTARARLGAVGCGGALATMIHGGLGVAVAAAAIVLVGATRGRRHGLAALALLLALGPAVAYAAAAMATAVPGAPALALPTAGRLALLLLPALAIGAIVDSFGQLALRPAPTPGLPATVRTIAAGVAATAWLAPTGAAAWLQLQPLGLAALLVLLVPRLGEPTATRVSPVVLIGAMALALTLALGRFPLGRPPVPWGQRLGQLATALAARADHRLAPADDPETAAYARALAAIPTGARVGAWTDRADLLDYRRHRVVDLRSTAATGCVGVPPARLRRRTRGACAHLAATLTALDLDYLVVGEAALAPAWASAVPGWLCPACRDPVSAALGDGHPLPSPPGLRVVRLGDH